MLGAVNELMLKISHYGVPFLFVNVLLEQLGLPVPAYPSLVIAGALSAQGALAFPRVAIAVLVAAILPDTLWFLLGRKYGAFMLKLVCRVSLSPDTCVRQTEGLFDRFGARALLFSKFIPGFSMVAPPLAGSLKTPLYRFLLYDAGGTMIWAGLALVLGAAFRRTVDRVLVALQALGARALLVLGAALLLFILAKWWQRRRFYKALRMARITPQELRELMDKGETPLVFDVRGKQTRELDPRHVPGAVVLDLPELDHQVTGLPRDGFIVLYCT
jgi:membrane protein DedA with SNARE-associated domain